jgi:hypothetical protein
LQLSQKATNEEYSISRQKGKSMLRNMFVTCLALVLALSMTLQAARALAQEESRDSGAGSQGFLTAITKVSLLKGFPPRVRIEGTLPNGCTKLVVDQPVVGKLNPNTSITPVTILVRGVRQHGAVCATVLKPFAVTLTLDPFKFHLAPGRYRVRINPRMGQDPNQILITIPPGLD